MGGNPTTFAGSDHGFAPQWYAVNANKVLFDATVAAHRSLHASDAATCSAAREQRERLELQRRDDRHREGVLGRRDDPDLRQPDARRHGIHVPTYEAVRTADARRLPEPDRPGEPGQAGRSSKIMNKEELRNVDGSDSLHPNRSGDVVVVTAAAVPVGRGRRRT